MSNSRSIGATTATQNTSTTVNSQIAIAYSNQKTHHKLEAWYFGPGKKPFKYGVASALCGLFVLVAGLAVLGLRFDGRLLVGSWEGEFIAPCIIICGLLLFALAIWFILLARKKSNAERERIAFRPEGLSSVSTVNMAYQPDRSLNNKYRYDVKSGSSSEKAVRSANNSTYTWTLESRVSRGKRSTHTGSLPSLDGRARTHGSLPSLDNQLQSTPKKAETPGSTKGPPKPMRSLNSSMSGLSDGQPTKAPMAALDDDDDDVFTTRERSVSQYSDVPLD